MHVTKPYALLFVAWVLLASPAGHAQSPRPDDGDRVVRMATAEWPPYLGESLEGQGALGVLLHEAFARQGYRLELQFFPWVRTLQRVSDPHANLDGYVVDYFSEQVAADYLLSRPVAWGPLVLVERTGTPVPWQTLDDLRKYRLGVVSGYINTHDLDRMIARGDIFAEAVADDTTNLRRLAAGRVDVVTVDQHVFEWLMITDPVLQRQRVALRLSGKVLEEKALYACFRKTARGEVLRKALDAALAQQDVHAAVHGYILDRKAVRRGH